MWLHITKTINHEHYKTWMAIHFLGHSFSNYLLLHLEMVGQWVGSFLAHLIPDSVFHCRLFCSLSQSKGIS
nr:MAG TPA: hypothetical protein [Caudoviricetes sp.]